MHRMLKKLQTRTQKDLPTLSLHICTINKSFLTYKKLKFNSNYMHDRYENKCAVLCVTYTTLYRHYHYLQWRKASDRVEAY